MGATRDGDTVPLGFGGMTVSGGGRIAHFYRTREEMLAVLGPYVAQGMRRGDRCVAALNATVADSLSRWLDRGRRRGSWPGDLRLVIVPPGGPETGGPGIELERELGADPGAQRFIRFAWDGTSGLYDGRSPLDVVRFLNLYEDLSIGLGRRRLVLSLLDLTAFGGDVVVDVLRLHALCILGEIPLRCSPATPPKLFRVTQ